MRSQLERLSEILIGSNSAFALLSFIAVCAIAAHSRPGTDFQFPANPQGSYIFVSTKATAPPWPMLSASLEKKYSVSSTKRVQTTSCSRLLRLLP